MTDFYLHFTVTCVEVIYSVLVLFYPDFYKSPSREGLLSFVIFFSDDVAKFQVRGALLLKPGREPSVSLSQNPLSDEDRTKLKVNHVNHVTWIDLVMFSTHFQDGPVMERFPLFQINISLEFFLFLFFLGRGGESMTRA